MEGGSPILEWITYGIIGFVLLALLLLALRSASFFLSLLAIPVLGALGRTRLAGGLVRRWGERGPAVGLPVLSAADEEAVDEAAAGLSRVRVPRAVRLGIRTGAVLGALPGVWLAARGAQLGSARGESPAEVAATVAFALCLVSAAGAIAGAATGAVAGAGVDAIRRGRHDGRAGDGRAGDGRGRDARGAPGD
jgi:hypothetical protein